MRAIQQRYPELCRTPLNELMAIVRKLRAIQQNASKVFSFLPNCSSYSTSTLKGVIENYLFLFLESELGASKPLIGAGASLATCLVLPSLAPTTFLFLESELGASKPLIGAGASLAIFLVLPHGLPPSLILCCKPLTREVHILVPPLPHSLILFSFL
jgi:hypothetical protein